MKLAKILSWQKIPAKTICCFRDMEHYDECRKVFQMGINSASDDPERVCEAMLQFEREHGSLETFEAALDKCSAQLKRVRERREIVSYE